jgi:hypothetical protein
VPTYGKRTLKTGDLHPVYPPNSESRVNPGQAETDSTDRYEVTTEQLESLIRRVLPDMVDEIVMPRVDTHINELLQDNSIVVSPDQDIRTYRVNVRVSGTNPKDELNWLVHGQDEFNVSGPIYTHFEDGKKGMGDATLRGEMRSAGGGTLINLTYQFMTNLPIEHHFTSEGDISSGISTVPTGSVGEAILMTGEEQELALIESRTL